MSRQRNPGRRVNGQVVADTKPPPKRITVCEDPDCPYCLAFPDGVHRWTDLWDRKTKLWKRVQEQRPDGTILP